MNNNSFCIIFDCDGVLVNSEPYSCESLRQATLQATGYDIPHEFPDDYFELFGLSVRSSVELFVKKGVLPADTDVDLVSQKMDYYKDDIYMDLAKGKLTTFPGLENLLKEAKQRKISMGVGSSGTPTKIQFNLREAGIISHFKDEYIVSSTELGRGKPAPDIYLEVMKRMGYDAKQAVVIEDACAGLQAAKAAGACAIGVTTSLPRTILEPFADMIFESFEDMNLKTLEEAVNERGRL
eukprot:jgi/Galph1/2620/GphlegSOOS_G1279.1